MSKQVATKYMAKRLEEHGSYKHMLEHYKIAQSNDEYIQWLKSAGILCKLWHNKIVEHFK